MHFIVDPWMRKKSSICLSLASIRHTSRRSNAKYITGSICGVKIEEIEDPLMKKIRYMDKLVDELAKGRSMEKIFRAGEKG